MSHHHHDDHRHVGPFKKIKFGTNGDDAIPGSNHSDIILGFGGNDTIVAGLGNDIVLGGRGNDWIDGGKGNDTLFGESGNDALIGGNGNDDLHGGRGRDLLLGDAGRDHLSGDEGNDKFLLRKGMGVDTIERLDAGDRIDVRDFNILSFQTLIDSARQVGHHVQINLGHGDTLIIEHARISDLHAEQFILSNEVTGTSSSQTPHLLSSNSHVYTESLLTTGDSVNGYKMAGIPDGLGAFDNGDGTFTVLMNHELPGTAGIARAHGGTGQVYFYSGTKQATGNVVEKAGLTGGHLLGIHVSEFEGSANNAPSSTSALGTDEKSAFTMIDLGDVSGKTGAQIDADSETAGVTSFLRPEDGAWDTLNPNRFYFVSTNAFNAPSQLWALDFTDASHPELGGTIKLLLNGSEGQQMLDNITVDSHGKLILSEDVGNNAHLGKVWQYDPATDSLTQLAQHDASRFVTGGANFLTQDEEASGVIDVSHILGNAGENVYLIDTQSHLNVGGELVEGGQLQLIHQYLV
ncbi:calcium-binding protein [Bradyrhizobium liaoningense]